VKPFSLQVCRERAAGSAPSIQFRSHKLPAPSGQSGTVERFKAEASRACFVVSP